MSLSFSVVIPVLNEQASINAMVDHVRARAVGRPVEIVVADGHARATTLDALARPGVVGVAAPAGRARQMNAGARAATGDVLVFLHADCALPEGAFAGIERVLYDGTRQAGAFGLAIAAPRLSLGCIAAAATLRSKLTRVPYGDQAQFFTRRAFDMLGGFADLPMLEDVDIMERLRRYGMRIGFAPGRVTASARRWEAEGVWRRTAANRLIMLLYTLGVTPGRLAPLYRARQNTEDIS